ncbi:hypothetical protein AB0J90_10920 [Micromonospora sp. NPDC049523]|uniref:hypothetical protein n=1 Tax=Micromonospora sp. NPDC049523 TaxID=3155921 RepID=UPI003447CD1A
MSDDNSWPSLRDYLTAMQRPAGSLLGDKPGRFVPLREADDTILPVQGQSAYVFYGHLDGTPTVLRCFKRPPDDDLRERYLRLARYTAEHACPYFADFEWWDGALYAGGRHTPVLLMEDVGGRSIRQHLAIVRGDEEKLDRLADQWCGLTTDLTASALAHGDLQQDNIWIAPDDRLRLIDLDAVWAPPLADLPPREVGHPNFQHPKRISDGYWGSDVDRFSALVVLISIRALARDPGLWDEYHLDENLIFTEEDFTQSMVSPIWFRLASNSDPRVRDLTTQLAELCAAGVAGSASASPVTRPVRKTAPVPPVVARPGSDGTEPGPAQWTSPRAEPVVIKLPKVKPPKTEPVRRPAPKAPVNRPKPSAPVSTVRVRRKRGWVGPLFLLALVVGVITVVGSLIG